MTTDTVRPTADERDAQAYPPGLAPLLGPNLHWGWMLALGILFLVLGTLAFAALPLLTLTTVLVFGVLLVVGGAFQIAHAVTCGGWRCAALHLSIGAVYVVAGVIAVLDPALSSLTLTLAFGFAIAVVGVLRSGMALRVRGRRGWGWLLVSGLLSVVLGVLVVLQWPASGVWFIGLVVAVELIFHGWAYLFLSLAERRARAAAEA